MLITQRPGKFALLSGFKPGSQVTNLKPEVRDVYVKAEAGLLGMVIHPDFERTRQFTVCQTYAKKGKVHDIRLVTWRLSEDEKRVEKVKNLRRVSSYGHRNVQGVAIRPGTHEVYTSSHGPDRDDEINRNEAGEHYGWDPSLGGESKEYNESAAMTDKKLFPDAVDALWSSGMPTEAIGAVRFIEGEHWGPLDGALVALCLKGPKMLIFTLDKQGAVTNVAKPPEFDQTYGRLRATHMGPDGALYVSTSNGKSDKLLRVTPKG